MLYGHNAYIKFDLSHSNARSLAQLVAWDCLARLYDAARIFGNLLTSLVIRARLT